MTLESTRNADEGLYTVNIEVSLKNYPDIKDVATVTIQIDPCQVNTLVGRVEPATATYAIAANEMTSFAYFFEQTNACGYIQTVDVSNMPDFMTRNYV